MGYLFLSICSSVGVSLVMRLSAKRAKGSLCMLATNYLMCLFIALCFTGPANAAPALPGLGQALGLGAVNGILYLASFVIYQRSVARNGIVLSSTFMKLGLLVPIAVSVIWELPTIVQIVGFLIALVGIVFISGSKEDSARFSPGLILLLVLGGGANAMSEVFEEVGNKNLSSQFLLYTFGAALVLCVLLALFKKEQPNRYSLFYGFLIGIPNYFSARFLLLSLQSVPAMIAHPTYSAVSVAVVAVLGVCAFHERLSKKQWTAMALILLSLILLNL
ncbi:MAG: EamA family transporter [Oscillospiraceae bacterium]|nr:EamA family transporter [Oscillospiraceae bacterium]